MSNQDDKFFDAYGGSDSFYSADSGSNSNYDTGSYNGNYASTENMSGYGLSEGHGNWPAWLVPKDKQEIFGVIALVLSFFLGIVGIIVSGYYLFYLDDSVEKVRNAKLMNKIAFWLPIVLSVTFFVIFLLFFIIGIAAGV